MASDAPLRGQKIIVTRTPHQAEELAVLFEALGATVLRLPAIAIESPADPEPLQRAIRELASYDWLIFTSTNAVLVFQRALLEQGLTLPQPPIRIATVGEPTRAFVEQLGWSVSVTPREYVSEALVEAFAAESVARERFLIPSAAVTRDVVAPALRERGAVVDVVAAYQTVLPQETRENAARILSEEPKAQWITFASSSAVKNIITVAGTETLRGIRTASIGPITSDTLREYGLPVDAEAKESTMQALAEAVVFRVLGEKS